MARTQSADVKARRDKITEFCKSNAPCTFKDVLLYAVEEKLPAMPTTESKQVHTVRSDLHKLRQSGAIRPEFIVVKTDW